MAHPGKRLWPEMDSGQNQAEAAMELGRLNSRVLQFFQDASTAPAPLTIEAEETCDGPQIEMNLILGVLEARPKRDVVLPTPAAIQQMNDEDEAEAEAFAALIDALRGPRDDDEIDDEVDEEVDSDLDDQVDAAS